MADSKLLKEQDQRALRWMIVLPFVVIGMLVVGLVVINSLYGRRGYFVGMYDAHKPVSMVSYHGERWQPEGRLVTLPDNRMVAVGVTDQGYLIYTTRDELGGGAGPHVGTQPHAYGHVYLRSGKALYQPLQPRPAKPASTRAYPMLPSGPRAGK